MKRMSARARRVLVTAQELARLRNAAQCEVIDLAIAAIVHRHIASQHETAEHRSTSPDMLPLAPELERALTDGDGEFDMAAITTAVRGAEPMMVDYLT